MIAQRVGVAALRRAAAKPNVFFNQTLPKVAFTAGIATTPSRPSGIASLTPAEGDKILINQRVHRPVAPHLGIYKLEQSWFGSSAWTRITGCTLSVALYAYAGSYLVAPLFGWHFESASFAAAVGGLPFLVNGGLKFGLAFPFVYHCVNGVKHLTYDLGWGFAKPFIRKADLAVWGSAFVLGAFLAFGV
ncbi:hypothetical protein G7046_g962 [Stylonectria norvegica]|nr:hypothetical protein G7046_g962 [Stylonectria norvegica]